MGTFHSPLFGGSFPVATKSPLEREYRRIARRTPRIRALLDAMIGATAGGTATDSYARVAAGDEDDGGNRPIETVYRVNRATTADDKANLLAMIDTGSRGNWPIDRAGSWGA